MEDSWQNWLSHLGMNDGFSFTNAEEMLRFNSDSFVAKQEYSPCLNNSSQEELGSCYFPIRGAESHAKPRENNFNRGTKRARTSSETQHHIMSERKRRQDIAEKFIALSAIIPGLKKIDKATVLGEAINYMRQLEQRIAVLEKGNDNNKSIKSVMVTKSGLCSASASCNEVIPEVEARGLDKDVLIRIYCHKRKGIMLKLLALLKDVHLSIASTSVLPFGNSILSIIIIAQMTEKYNLTMNDLVNKVKQIF